MSISDLKSKFWLLTLFYTLALSLIAALVVGNYVLVQRQVNTQETFRELSAQGVRQGRLAGQVVRISLELAINGVSEEARAAQLASLRRTMDECLRVQEDLRASPVNNVEILAAYQGTDPYLQSMSNALDALIAEVSSPGGVTLSPESPLLGALQQNRGPFVEQMEAIVALYDREADARLAQLRRTQMVSVLVILATLLLEGFFIFRPISQVIERSYRTLLETRTELEHKNRQLDVALVEANSSAKAREVFLATMSHEIRTPMNGVIGMTGLLLDTPLNRDQKEMVETIRISGDALLHVINDVLDFSKIQSGHMEIEQIPFDLTQCLEDTLDMLAPLALAKHLDLSSYLEEGVPNSVIGDPYRLRQILINLVGNALKFTSSGEVALECGLDTECAGPKGEPMFRFTVRDTGVGIPEDAISRLFLSFSQVDATTTRKHGGTGLGLAICKRLVELMGGEISVSSVKGAGSIFKFSLPLQICSAPPPTTMVNLPAEVQGKLVLIVDDNHTNIRIFDRLCRKWGLRTQFFSSPIDALAWCKTNTPDLLLTDMFMPEMDGLDFCLAVREIQDKAARESGGTGSRMPIILASSGGYHSDDLRCVQVELSARLTKPIRKQNLLEAIADALSETQHSPEQVLPSPGANKSDFARMHPRRMLIVEDNKLNQKVATRLLASLGYTADIAEDGYEALEACRNTDYDVVFMDIQMPNLDGLSAARMLRDEFRENRPYIIAMTANAMEEDRQVGMAAGMDGYVSKPVRVEDIKRALVASPEPAAVA